MEQLNKSALQAHGLDKNGQLYKVNYFEFQRDADVIRLADDPKYNLSKFEEKLEVKGNSDHTKLIAMLNQLNDYSVPMSSILGKYFDTENLAYWMAFQLLTGNTDTQSRNMYLYSPTMCWTGTMTACSCARRTRSAISPPVPAGSRESATIGATCCSNAACRPNRSATNSTRP